jgi:hypothetical protein
MFRVDRKFLAAGLICQCQWVANVRVCASLHGDVNCDDAPVALSKTKASPGPVIAMHLTFVLSFSFSNHYQLGIRSTLSNVNNHRE